MSVVFCQKILCIYWYDLMICFQLILLNLFLVFSNSVCFLSRYSLLIHSVYSSSTILLPLLLSHFALFILLHEICLYLILFSAVKLYNINFYVIIWTLISWNSFSVTFFKIINWHIQNVVLIILMWFKIIYYVNHYSTIILTIT